MKKNDLFLVEIIDMNMLGYGIAKIDNTVVFVQNGVTGDKCEIKIIKVAKNYAVARTERIVEHSEFRIIPECPHFKRCGGCAFQSISYEYEKTIKKHYVESELIKENLSGISVNDVLSNNVTEHYRNKAQYPVGISKDGKFSCGFYSPKTHDVQNIDKCLIQNERFDEIKNQILNFMTKRGIRPYSEIDETGCVRHLFFRASKNGDIEFTLILAEKNLDFINDLVSFLNRNFPEIKTFLLNYNLKKTNVILGNEWEVIFGDGYIEDAICDKVIKISPQSFYQVNHDVCEILYNTAFEMADFDKNDTVLDLYCGVGTIGLSLSDKVKKIVGVEIIPEAVENARRNAKINKIENAEFFVGDANTAFDDLHKKFQFDAVILDPPRKGAGKELIEKIISSGIEKILYISCSFDTLCRDMKIFSENGYGFSNIQPVDMFPRTSHVETVVLLSRA